MITIDGQEATPEAYEACEIPLDVIKEMIEKKTWEGSLEEEEVLYNLENNLYSEEYKNNVNKLLGK